MPLSLDQLRERASGLHPRIYEHRLPRRVARVHERVGMTPHLQYLHNLQQFLRGYATQDLDAADLFFVPASMVSFQFTNVMAHRFRWRQAPELGAILEQLPHLDRGRHLLLATGDFGQRARSPWESHAAHRAYPELYTWLDERFILAAFESTAQLLPQDVPMLPYPLAETAPPTTPPERDLLYGFVGRITYPELAASHIRGGALAPLVGQTRESFVGTAEEAIAVFGQTRGNDTAMIARSVFTICPAGYGRWTFRLGQALAAGSIPVILADGYLPPHQEFIDWTGCALIVAEHDVEMVPEVLRSISRAEIRERQQHLYQHRHLFGAEGVHLMTLISAMSHQGRA